MKELCHARFRSSSAARPTAIAASISSKASFTIVADLNVFSVPTEDRGTFDLLTNFGTMEHVANQINAFCVLHDYARAGSLLLHSVPFSGYFNHGLYNYHPLFFVFLAAANGYRIEVLNLSPPHLPYGIPQFQESADAQHGGAGSLIAVWWIVI